MSAIESLTQPLPILYRDLQKEIQLKCYVDTLVYREESGICELAAVHFGGYSEHVRAMTTAVCAGGGIEVQIDRRKRFMQLARKSKRKALSYDGVYAEGAVMAEDDELGERQTTQQEDKTGIKRKLYLFCEAGSQNSLFREFDKKISMPLLPEFQDYILEECREKKLLIPLRVLSVSRQFDAYLLEVHDDEREVKEMINRGLKTGKIAIPRAKADGTFRDICTVSQYLNRFGVEIAERIRGSFTPLFDPSRERVCGRLTEINENIQKNTGYSLYAAQLAVAEAIKRRLDHSKIGIIIAECGSGKSKIGAAALGAQQGGSKTLNVVLCPSHITKKWVRELEETLPNTRAAVVHSLSDIRRVCRYFKKSNESVYMVLSKERARDGYMRRPAVYYSAVRQGYVCPQCGKTIESQVAGSGSKYTEKVNQFFFQKENAKNHTCSACGSSLWTALNPGDTKLNHNQWVKIGGYGFVDRKHVDTYLATVTNPKVIRELTELMEHPQQIYIAKAAYARYSMSQYISQQVDMLDGCILDELHLFKGDSGQGNVMARLIGCSKKVIGMTATLVNGYSSGLFYLLFRIVPQLMLLDHKNYDSPTVFNNEYGVTESVYQTNDEVYNAKSRSKKRLIRERQLPGVSPLVYTRFLMECAAFLSLGDMGKDLPDYEEIPIALSLREDVKKEYERILEVFHTKVHRYMDDGRKLMSKFLSLLTTYSDQPYNAEPIMRLGHEMPLITPKNLSNIHELHEKDIAVLDIVRRKREAGEKVLIYTSWVKIDTQEKLQMLLEKEGYRVAVLEQNISPEKREEWVAKRLEAGADVLICNPSLVETGLDLNAFTTLIYYNIGYNLFTFRQSSRRSWRINQKAPRIEVYILYYKGTMQAKAIKLMASKLASATLVEGNFTDEGLAALSDCNDLTSQLARELTLGISDEWESTAELFRSMALIKTKEEGSFAEKLKQALKFAALLNSGLQQKDDNPPPDIYYDETGQGSLFELVG